MRNPHHKSLAYGIGLLILVSLAGLWSWNTLSELFSLPQAQYRHALAALILLLILRRVFSSRRRVARRVFRGRHEDQPD